VLGSAMTFSSKCSSLGAMLWLAGGLLFLTSGISLLIRGLSDGDTAENLNPATDFEELPEICTIDKVTALKKDRSQCASKSGCAYFCDIAVSSLFTYRGVHYESSTHEETFTSKCEDTTTFLMSSWKTGDEVSCWHPVELPVSAEYNCGNPECYKVISPEQEVETLKEESSHDVQLGIGGIAIGTFVASVTIWYNGYCRRRTAMAEG